MLYQVSRELGEIKKKTNFSWSLWLWFESWKRRGRGATSRQFCLRSSEVITVSPRCGSNSFTEKGLELPAPRRSPGRSRRTLTQHERSPCSVQWCKLPARQPESQRNSVPLVLATRNSTMMATNLETPNASTHAAGGLEIGETVVMV